MTNTFQTPDAALQPAAIAAGMANEYAANIVETLNACSEGDAALILANLPQQRAVDVLDESGLERPTEIIDALPRETAASLLSRVSADRAADVFRHLPAASRDDLLARLDSATRKSLQALLAYPEDTAGSIMTTEFVSVPSDWTVERVLAHIRRVESTRETVYAIYVLDPATNQLVRTLSLRRLISSEPSAGVMSIVPQRKPVTVAPLTDREDVARLISQIRSTRVARRR